MGCDYALRISSTAVDITKKTKGRRQHLRHCVQRKDIKNHRRLNDVRLFVFQELARLSVEGRIIIRYYA